MAGSRQKNVAPKAQGKRPTISVAMMVKNEEKMLPRALESVKPWVDEIIVVDTGSTDRTVEIAASYGAKIYHHPWENNFSTHRNQSIGYCTGDWILILDADEELDQQTAPLMRQLTNAPEGLTCFLFKLYNDVPGGGATFLLHPRLFRNGVGFHYAGLVHNEPRIKGHYTRSEVKLIHYGYNLDPQTMEAKHQRRLGMLRQAIEREPHNFKAHAYLAQTLASRADTCLEAVDESLTAIRLAQEQLAPGTDFPRCYYPLLGALYALQRWDETIIHARACLEAMPNYPDPWLFLAHAYYYKRQWDDVCLAGRRFFEMQDLARSKPEDFLFAENQTFNQFPQVLHLWTLAEANRGDAAAAIDVFGRLVADERGESECRRLIKTLLTSGDPQLTADLVGLAAAERPHWDWLAPLKPVAESKAAEKLGRQYKMEARQALDEHRLDEAAKNFALAAEYVTADVEVHLGQAQALLGLGRHAEAGQALIKGLCIHPGHPWAWRALSELSMAKGQVEAAHVYLERYLAIQPGDQAARETLSRLQLQRAATPSVAETPPTLLVFLVGGLGAEAVCEVAPHFLMHRAWGRVMFDGVDPEDDLARWATLFCGRAPAQHGLSGRLAMDNPKSLADMTAPDIWRTMAGSKRVGLLAAPLCHPAPAINGWAVSGYPGGLLGEGLVNPPELLPRVLASGYRSDFVASKAEQLLVASLLTGNRVHEGRLYQIERNKLTLAAKLPAVDVLVIGVNCLEWAQQSFSGVDARVFAAHQQVYAIIEGALAGLRPKHFAVLGQRGYDKLSMTPTADGFYCLSWRGGENGRAPVGDVTAEILRLVG